VKRRAAVLSLLPLLIGCGTSAAPESVAAPEPAAAVAPAELGWDAQLAAVRAGRSDEIRLADELVTAARFRDLATGCEGLTTLLLDRADLRDEDLVVLRSLPKLRRLRLPAPVGDDGAAIIAECRALEILNLPSASFTDSGLAKLATLEHLFLLRFGSPNVTDEGLEPLTELPKLRFLHLLDVPITDAGLKHVAAIETLESFYLDGGRTTDTGLRDLLAARPDIHFHKDQHHLPGDPNADMHD
jgi:hypothetical protein